MVDKSHSTPVKCACGKRYRVPEKLEGKLGRCPSCGMVMRVPFAPRQSSDSKPIPSDDLERLRMETGVEEPAPSKSPETGDGDCQFEEVADTYDDEYQTVPQPSVPPPGKPAPPKRPRKKFAREREQIREYGARFQRSVLGVNPDLPLQGHNLKPLLKRLYVFLTILCVIFLGYVGWLFTEGAKAERAFKNLNKTVAKASTLEQRQEMYQRFIAQNPNSKYILDAREAMAKIPGLIDDRDFNEATKAGEAVGDRYEVVEKEYLEYVAKHSKGKHLAQVQKVLNELPDKIDDRDYRLRFAEYESLKEKPDEAEKALLAYLDQHPGGKHAGEMKNLLKQIPSLWEDLEFRDLLKQTEALGNRYEEWEKPLRAFLAKYPDGKHMAEAGALLAGLQDKIDDRDFEQLRTVSDIPFPEQPARYRSYLIKHHNGQHTKEVMDFMGTVPVRWAQDIAERVKTMDQEGKRGEAVALCRSFLKQYPEGDPARDVQQLVRNLEARNEADRVEQEYLKAAAVEKDSRATAQQTDAAYRGFLKKYPEGTFSDKARGDLKRLQGEMVAQEWKSVLRSVATPGISAQKATALVEGFLRDHPESAHLKEAEKIKAELALRMNDEKQEASWNQILDAIRVSGDINRSLDLVENFLHRYPNSDLRPQAQQQIVTLENLRYAALSPYPPNQATCTLRIKSEGKNNGYTLTGSVRDMDGSTYLVRDRANDSYYIKKNEVLSMECSAQAQYNSYLSGKQPKTAEDFKQVALWSQKAGLPDKVLINLVMAAYLRPDDSAVAQQLANNGFAYENGRWKSSRGIW